MVISEMLHSLLKDALEIQNIFVVTVTAVQFSKEMFSFKLDCCRSLTQKKNFSRKEEVNLNIDQLMVDMPLRTQKG